jgi:hypothetical protein
MELDGESILHETITIIGKRKENDTRYVIGL